MQFSFQPVDSQAVSSASLALNTQIILVRHGRSTFNEQGRYQGSSDAALLTELGRQTASQVGLFLKKQPVHAIYISPLKRVRQTTEAILNNMNAGSIRVEVAQNLQEIEMYAWEGQSFQQIEETFAADYQCWKQRPHEFQLEVNPYLLGNNTSLATTVKTRCFPVIDLYKRAQQFWQEILPRHLGQTILIVSHGGTNRALISTALGLAPSQFHTLQQSNCGISSLKLPAGSLKLSQLERLNLTTPIGETLPKLKEGKTGLRLLLLSAETTHLQASQLSTLLKTVAVDFSLTSVSAPAQKIADQMLSHHPQTVRLQTHHDRFLSTWQHTIQSKYQQESQLLTGLVVAESSDIQQILGQAIGLSADQVWRIYLQPGTLSILHHPHASHLPVLQALNFS